MPQFPACIVFVALALVSVFLFARCLYLRTSACNMGMRKNLTSPQTSSTVSLYKANQSTKDIARNVGVTVRAVHICIKKFRYGGGEEIPTYAKGLGLDKKVSFRTANLAKRQVEGNGKNIS